MVERPTPSETQQQVFMPPSGELEGRSRGGGLILGRLAELAVLGLVVVLLVGTLIYLFALRTEPAAGESLGGSEDPGSQESILKPFVQPQVGRARLTGIAMTGQEGDFQPLREGATESLEMRYRRDYHGPESEVVHFLAAFRSSVATNKFLEKEAERWTSERGLKKVREDDLRTPEGKVGT